MKKIYILFFLTLIACSTNQKTSDLNNYFLSDKMNFIEFSEEMEKYSKLSPYPNIDE